MFVPLVGQTMIGVRPEHVFAVIESLNCPNIAIPDVGTEPTKAWLVGCLTPAGGAAMFCCLWLTESRRSVLYVSHPSEVALDAYPFLEQESIHFVESMGFLLDNLNFRARTPAEQAHLFQLLPFLGPPPGPGVAGRGAAPDDPPPVLAGSGGAAVDPEADRRALFRLLASF
jgi:hypothetical protein